MIFGANAPDVEVVDIGDADDAADAGFDLVKAHAARRAFEEDVEGFTHDAEAGPEDGDANADGERRVDPGLAGHEDDPAADDDGGGGNGVADLVEEGAADVDVADGAPEEQGDAAIHGNTGGGDPDHETGADGLGMLEALISLVEDEGGNDDQRERVDEGGEDSGAAIAVSFGGTRGTAFKIDGGEGEQ